MFFTDMKEGCPVGILLTIMKMLENEGKHFASSYFYFLLF